MVLIATTHASLRSPHGGPSHVQAALFPRSPCHPRRSCRPSRRGHQGSSADWEALPLISDCDGPLLHWCQHGRGLNYELPRSPFASPSIASVERSTNEDIRQQAEELLEEHERKLANFAHQFMDLQGAPHEPVGYNACPPFSCRIQEEPIPGQFRMS